MVLSSKVLASCIEGDSLWTAESGWQARRINLEVGLEVTRADSRPEVRRCCTKGIKGR